MGETARGFHATATTTTTTKFKCEHRAPRPCLTLGEALGNTERQETELPVLGQDETPLPAHGASSPSRPTCSPSPHSNARDASFYPSGWPRLGTRGICKCVLSARRHICWSQQESWGPLCTHGFRKWAQDPHRASLLSITVIPTTKMNSCPLLPRGKVPESSCEPSGVSRPGTLPSLSLAFLVDRGQSESWKVWAGKALGGGGRTGSGARRGAGLC